MTISANYPTIRPSLTLDFANTTQLDPRITFSRPTVARYYNANTTALAEQNLVLQSQTFNTSSWVKENTTATPDDTTAPDGSSTADTLLETAVTGRHTAERNPPATIEAGTYTLSWFVKANGRTAVSIYFGSASSLGAAFFDLATPSFVFSRTTGAVVTVVGTPLISDSGNGWYRVSAVFSLSAALANGVWGLACSDRITNTGTFTFDSASYLGDITKGLFIWGAQVEQRSAPTAYNLTTTTPIINYIPVLLTQQVNESRFEHNPVTRESLGLLIEEQRTNAQVLSEDFSATSSLNQNITATNNANISPAGTLTAALIVENTATDQHRSLHYSLQSYVSGTSYTTSVYVKRASGTRNVILKIDAGSSIFGALGANYNLTALTVTPSAGQTGTITAVGNGWYRLTLTATASSSATPSYGIGVWLSNGTNPNDTSYTGDGGSGIYVWGAQTEAGAFATSYIPTVASQVTRSADVAQMTGANFSSWYRTDQGTLYTELVETFNTTALSGNSGGVSINANSTAPCIEITVRGNDFSLVARGFGGTASSISLPVSPAVRPAGTASKIAMTYTVDVFGSITNGAVNGLGATNATKSANPITGINQLDIGKQVVSGITIGTRTFKKIAYYPTSVTLANLQSLTGS